jgi:FixJ family two-component response regulator
MGQRLRDAGNMTPILFMSGYVDSMLPVGGILQPGVNFIQKPFAPDALARKVREMLNAAISQKAR